MNEREFGLVYDQYVKLVRTVIYRYSTRAPLDDLTQETFLRVWRFRHTIVKAESTRSWVARIALNTAIDWGRQVTTRKETATEDEVIAQGNLTQEVENRIIADRLLSSLDAESRVLLDLLYVQECSVEEVAEVLNVASGTVKSRSNRLKEKLKKQLESHQESDHESKS